jgi:hypothetical protein
MAVTFMTGCEGRDAAAADNVTVSGAVSSTTQHRTGAASIRCNPASGGSASFSLIGGGGTGFSHFGLFVATMPSVARVIAGNSSGSTLKLNSTGTIEVFDTTTSRGVSTTTLVTGQWYWIGYRSSVGTTTPLLQIDGVDQGITATVAAGNTQLGFSGAEASAADAYFDDIIIDGAGFLAASNVNLALPISDNTVTGVTDNNGVTTNIWQCVSNTPPAGVASANEAANPKKGMHFTASVTDNYLANLSTYTTLGVGASDTVLAVQSFVSTGEDIVTGTKNLQNVGALTNPTVAGVSVTAGADLGAHGAEVGLWAMTVGTLTTSPSVTLGTSPTIRTSRISETRLACVDFMGMYVAWTPAAVVAGNPRPALQARQAVNRSTL